MSSPGPTAQPGRKSRAILPLLAHASTGAIALLLLIAVGRPLFTDDLWWHLALGESYLAEGPWLQRDPLLHTALGPPPPATWFADLILVAVERAAGFAGLRGLHAAVVATILALAWRCLRRASGCALAASFGAACFAALGAYRLFQLRPELASQIAAIAVCALVLRDRERPGGLALAGAVAICGAWANLHAAFALGPLLLFAGAVGAALEIPWLAPAQRPPSIARAFRLGAAAIAALLAACANPSGPAAYLPYLRAGSQTPDLEQVSDEWARFAAFSLPLENLPPSPLCWALVWFLLLATPLAIGAWLRRLHGGRHREPDLDPALIGISLCSLVAMLAAVRFVWLGVFPLWLLAQALRAAPRAQLQRAPLALATAALLPAFMWLGDWPFLSRGLSTQPADYLEPYAVRKYFAHAAWFLDDAALRGKLYNAYFSGGFLGFWLRPELRVFVNGSLNLPPDVMKTYHAIQAGGTDPAARDLSALLDAYGVDLFLGIGMPAAPIPNRPWQYTTSHLERDARWLLVFRAATSAVYLRRSESNRENLARVADYYARAGIPFDSARGLDPEQVLHAAPAWAVEHGLVPVDYAQLEAASTSAGPQRRAGILERLANANAVLGLYERSAALDRQLLGLHPGWTPARRRLVWSLLRQGRAEQARAEASRLRQRAPTDGSAAYLEATANEYAATADREQRNGIAATLLLFSREEALGISSRYRAPEARRHPR